MFLTLYGSTAAELREHYIRWWFVPVAAALLRREGFGSVTVAFAPCLERQTGSIREFFARTLILSLP